MEVKREKEEGKRQEQRPVSFPCSTLGGGWPFKLRRYSSTTNNIDSSSSSNNIINSLGASDAKDEPQEPASDINPTNDTDKNIEGGSDDHDSEENNVPAAGESSSTNTSPNIPNHKAKSCSIYSNSPATLATLEKIGQRPRRGKPAQRASRRTVHDNTSPGYGWLLPGWIAEERLMEHGRVYKYYFDPAGNMYRSQEEVLHSWEALGLIVLDK